MSRVARVWLVVLILTAASVPAGAPSTVHACSCAQLGTPPEALAQATAVFAGRVTSLDPMASGRDVLVKFEVSRVWKGPVEAEVTLTTASSGASCGYAFQHNVEYVVYAHGEAAHSCSLTHPLRSMREELSALGPGVPVQGFPSPGYPGPPLEGTSDGGDGMTWVWPAGALVVLATLAVFLGAYRWQRTK